MLQNHIFYRWLQPESGPAKNADELAQWASGALLSAPGIIYANQRDVAALRGTMLAERVTVPQHGVVQAGTLWFEVAA